MNEIGHLILSRLWTFFLLGALIAWAKLNKYKPRIWRTATCAVLCFIGALAIRSTLPSKRENPPAEAAESAMPAPAPKERLASGLDMAGAALLIAAALMMRKETQSTPPPVEPSDS